MREEEGKEGKGRRSFPTTTSKCPPPVMGVIDEGIMQRSVAMQPVHQQWFGLVGVYEIAKPRPVSAATDHRDIASRLLRITPNHDWTASPVNKYDMRE